MIPVMRYNAPIPTVEGIAMKETMKAAGYAYVRYSAQHGGHILRDVDTGKEELWVANKNHASYGIIWKNTHLEFVTSVL